MISWTRLRRLVKKEFAQAFRSRPMRFMMIAPPIAQLIIFGYAVSTDVNHIRAAVLDQDNSPASREVIARLEGSGCFEIAHRPANPAELRGLLDGGAALAAVVIGPDFQRRRERGLDAPIQLILDGTDSNTALIARAYAEAALAPVYRFTDSASRLGKPAVAAKPRVWFNANLESRMFFIPGVIAEITMLLALMMTGMSLARERERGTLEQLLVTPLRRTELILGKCIPPAIVAAADVAFITAMALILFNLPLRGSVPLLAAAMALFLGSCLAFGIFISAIARTQQQAMMLAFVFMMPTVLLSGFAFPIHNMPTVIQWATYVNPMRYIIAISRGIFLKGVGLETLYPEFLALALLCVVVAAAAVLRFRRQLD